MKGFQEISCSQLKDNPFTLIGKDWMLVTAGTEEKYNTMTASWGASVFYGTKTSRLRLSAHSAIRSNLSTRTNITHFPFMGRKCVRRFCSRVEIRQRLR